jgi:hypothetical protein
VDVGRFRRKNALVGAAIGLVLGLPTVVSAVVALAQGENAVGVSVALVLGLALLSMPVITVRHRKTMLRSIHLVLDRTAMRWVDPHGAAWAVDWPELAS